MTTDGEDWAPASCTLPVAEVPGRVAEFGELFASGLREVERQGPTELRVTLDGVDEARARDLAARETACCSFFEFTFTPGLDGEVQMKVTVPAAHTGVLDALAAGLRHE